jgi:hypothetical protein
MNTNEILRDNDDIRFFTEVHLLAGKLVPVVVIHSLEGSRANRHHTPNPQSCATQPTQDEDHRSHTQSTRVHFGSPPGKSQEPLIITMIRAGDKYLPPLEDPCCTKTSRWRQPPRETRESTAKHNHQVPLDVITQAMHLDSLSISQR